MKTYVPGLVLCLALVLFSGCSDGQKPRNLIPEDTYIDLLVELQLVNSYSQSESPANLAADSLVQEVLGHYQVTREQFKKSHAYYQEQTEEQKERIDRAIEKLRMDMVQDTMESEKNTK